MTRQQNRSLKAAGGATRLRIGVDTGGTFTDLIVMDDEGRVIRAKVLSTPDDYSRGVLDAIGAAARTESFSLAQVGGIVHGTTVATNAVLENKGPRVGLITTRGFRDVLEIGRCRWGGDIFDLDWLKPSPLVPRHLRREVDERIAGDGSVVCELDPRQVLEEARRLHAAGVRAIAVCFINAYANPMHECTARELIERELPDVTVSVSTDVVAEIREFERTSTTVVNAFLVPVVRSYLGRLREQVEAAAYAGDLQVMQSNGGVTPAANAGRRPVTIVESGPAAGVLACAYLAQQTGEKDLIAFDMGGTTAKASLIEDGRWFEAPEYHVGGAMSHGKGGGGGQVLRMPSIDIAEVGSGGGSIAYVDEGGLLKVGPRSAGSKPGPACYGLGGEEPTVTDAYAVLGYLNPDAIAGGARAIDVARARAVIDERIARPLSMTVEQAAFAIYELATANIVRAVRAVTVERGRDPRDYALVAFGGAGPLHAAALARSMQLDKTIVPSCSGLFSALGLLMADVEQDYVQTWLCSVTRIAPGDVERISAGLQALAERARSEFSPAVGADLELKASLALQYIGQSHEIVLPAPENITAEALLELAGRFCAEHNRTYGYEEPVARVQLVGLRLKARVSLPKPSYAQIGRNIAAARSSAVKKFATRRAYFGAQAGWLDATVVRRESIRSTATPGPAIIEELDTTIVVPPEATYELDEYGSIVLRRRPAGRTEREESGSSAADTASGIVLELVNNALDSVTDQMASILTRTARSLGVKDARDFSIALCTPEGELVSGGVGLAIHLGAVPMALAAVRTRFGDDLHEGDVIFMNDPYSGGMHLPDVYMMKPLFHEGRLLAWAAVVAHMADIGGRVPGGNAADSTSIFQEGLRIPPAKLYSRGVLVDAFVDLVRANVRLGDLVVGDLLAEVAACATAEREIRLLADRYGVDALLRHMDALIDYGERMARSALEQCVPGRYSFSDRIDDDGAGGEPVVIKATVNIARRGVRVDLTGSAPQVKGAINAPLAITRSTVAFVIRSLFKREIPNNSGFTRIIEVVAPEGTVTNMSYPAACAARAVTAYRLMDTLYGALAPGFADRVPAASDGGPAIVSVGGTDARGEPFVFMEVLSGAFGARPAADGLEGIALPFANTHNTSAELIEAKLPLRVEYYGFVPDTGGAGRYRGGLAVRRDIRLLHGEAVLQIRADRRRFAPWGLHGGGAGTTSMNTVTGNDGTRRELPGKVVAEIRSGEVWSHVTASGGGWGRPEERDPAAVRRDVLEERLGEECARRLYPHAFAGSEPACTVASARFGAASTSVGAA